MSVQVRVRLGFDIVLSTCARVNVPSKSKVELVDVTRLKSGTTLLMQDIATANMVFTFGFNGSPSGSTNPYSHSSHSWLHLSTNCRMSRALQIRPLLASSPLT